MLTEEFLKIFFAIFVVMDAFGNLPVFYTLTRKQSPKIRLKSANITIFTATAVLLLFLFFGNYILDYFGINIGSFRIAGGIILLIIGIKIVLGLRFREDRAQKYQIAVVPMATPLITGPGTITTVMIMAAQFGYYLTLIASLLNLFIAWIVLRNSRTLFKFLGRQGSDVLARIFGIILVALAVEFIREGLSFLV